ncbi:glycoside hydrolase family 18 protein [Bowmanella dokdonensis]|uniref:chitinase n=1 Tax=Bowmanella dokdonensis TaxID=751969 RepID=A0A939IL68_9ALTE|nr:glycoside hydrolase family 18 protein [Bowmanella dokdonensis]MBN7823903.1 glycoside hydrolase family 18 protein [Bowmanella dokdonensis]
MRRILQDQTQPLSGVKYALCLILFCCLPAQAKQPVVASYYMASGNPMAVSNLPAEKLSHILYAFVALCGDNSGADEKTRQAIEIACRDKAPYSAVFYNEKEVVVELAAFSKLKQQHPHLRILPSFGGWTLSHPFHGMAKSEAARKHFVQSAVTLVAQHDVFDGIDIDWEYPGGGGNSQILLTGQQAQNEKQVFALLMQELRAALNNLGHSTGRDYQLTAAVSGSRDKTRAIDWQQAAPVMDYIFAMTYDFAVGDGQAAHHTNLFSSDQDTLSTAGMINNLLNAGVPPEKLVVGVAFYGRGWNNSDWHGTGFGGQQLAVSTGSYAYKELIATPPAGYEYGYDTRTEAAYYFNSATKGFISFDDTRSVRAKAKWLKDQGLAGLFSWQIVHDNGDLLDEMYKAMQSQEKDGVPLERKPQ